jgi:hypothetical protein
MTRFVMRSIALFPLMIAACDSTSTEEHLGKTDQRFTSGEAVLLDFEFDGRLIADLVISSDARPLIEAQLMYTVGQLNADRAVGRFERLQLSNIKIQSRWPGRAGVTYHAKLPVAWAGPSIPDSYALMVPAQVAKADQTLFAARYGKTCVDASAGEVNAGSMFLFYRPKQAGCAFYPNDVVTSTASVKLSNENTDGKYPEYHRIWEDDALQVVAMFSRSQADPNIVDDGSLAYDEFVRRAREYLLSVQPNEGQRATTLTTGRAPTANLRATLPNGRSVTIDVMLVNYRLADDGASFDRWYDALTPAADLILYNGHAGLGDNVRALMEKGSFRPRQYAIVALNGCDTLAYVNRTLADRRALLNPDDPFGTKYMDTVSNVMSGYFGGTSATSMTFIETVAAAGGASAQAEPRGPKTYQEIFASIDPQQLVVVTGEEDNEFHPGLLSAGEASPIRARIGTPPADAPGSPTASLPAPFAGANCDTAGRRRDGSGAPGLFAVLCLGVIAARRRLRVRVSGRTGCPGNA